MEVRLQNMHPLKRLKLRHQQAAEELLSKSKTSSVLPAKKRIKDYSWNTTSLRPTPVPMIKTLCLPAKKRIWAPQIIPESPPKQPDSGLDLNVLFETPLEKKKPHFVGFDDVDPTDSDNNDQQQEDENDDDGIVCGVCRSTDGDPSDPIVLCDGCDAMVHAFCYGYPLNQGVPEGDWFCATCQQSSSSLHNHTKDICCSLCPVKGGVMKPTTDDDRWAHIACALLVPEVFFRDPEGRGGIDCSRVPQKRWEETCYICDSSKGCAIQCSEPKCSLAFHVGCGLNEELCIEYKEARSGRGGGGGIVAGFCKSHSELWKKQQQTGKFRIVAREEDQQ
ncbi:hypothetical protein Syun_009089 [Stephania yunnanensis]|uniref:Protein Jade-1 n=1 Tax=Stephania yunnanensis TaxID=152371 RepID=A0AAP0KGI0_9MAGN